MAPVAPVAWLIAGLGNPGERYANTRHNIGRMVDDELARRSGERFRKVRFLPVDACRVKVNGELVTLAKAHGFMNESGPAYAGLARKHRVPADHVIAVHDELDLAFGALRVKLGGSTAGHNGLNSLAGALRTPEFHRIRLGIGRPPGRQDPADFVLQAFAKAEQPDVALLIDDAADAALSLIRDGLQATQDRYNRSGPRA